MSGIKKMVKCEVCPDTIGHRDSIEVGIRANGYRRVIHNRAKCRQRWAREKERIVATWPETREAARAEQEAQRKARTERLATDRKRALTDARKHGAEGVVMGLHSQTLVEVERPQPSNMQAMIEQARTAPVVVHADADEVVALEATPDKEDTMSAAPQEIKARKPHIYVKWRQETDEAILAFFGADPFIRGSGVRCYDYIKRVNPELVHDQHGDPIGMSTFSQHVQKVLANRGVSKVVAKPDAVSPDIYKHVCDLLNEAERSLKRHDLVRSMTEMLYRINDLDTLETFAGMVRGALEVE